MRSPVGAGDDEKVAGDDEKVAGDDEKVAGDDDGVSFVAGRILSGLSAAAACSRSICG